MELQVTRDGAVGDALPGRLALAGVFRMFTLERATVAIAAGRYALRLTPSYRASLGRLWTPWPDWQLPEIVVPGRNGIRIHAANDASQLDGCIAVGQYRQGVDVLRSRDALMALYDLSPTIDDDSHITIEDAAPMT